MCPFLSANYDEIEILNSIKPKVPHPNMADYFKNNFDCYYLHSYYQCNYSSCQTKLYIAIVTGMKYDPKINLHCEPAIQAFL